MQEILKDKSAKKQLSHSRLAIFMGNHDVDAVVRVYQRNHLLALCEAYCVSLNKRATKKVLALQLMQAVSSNTSIPLTVPVDSRGYSV